MTNALNTMPAETDVDRLARRQTLRRIAWKFLVVLVALLAYSGLRWIEGEKSSYDEERGRPVVIVEDKDLESGALPRDATLLKVGDVKKVFDPESLAAAGLDPEALKLDLKALRQVSDTVPKITYQSLKGPKEIVERLDDEIFAAAEDKKKAFLATEDTETKARVSALPGLNQDRLLVLGRLKEIYKSKNRISQEVVIDDKEPDFERWMEDAAKGKSPANKAEIDAWRPMLAEPAGNLSDGKAAVTTGRRHRRAPAGLTAENLARWRAKIERQLNDNGRVEYINGKIKQTDDEARAQVRAVYTVLRPELPKLLDRGVNPSRANGSETAGFFSPRALLDEGSGTYVVYQTLRLIFVVVLVCAVLFVALLLLRPMPFFANATDALREQASGLFGGGGGGGAAPQVARTIAMTVAALGIGAAVAVAGINVGGGGKGRGGGRGGGDTPAEQSEDGQPGARGPRGRNGGDGLQGGPSVVEHRVTLTEPIISPSPVTVTVNPPPFTFDYARLGTLESNLGRLTNVTDVMFPDRFKRVEDDVKTLRDGDVKTLKENIGNVKVGPLNDDVNRMKEGLTLAQAGVQDYMSWKTTVAANLAEAINNLQARLDTTNAAVVDLRDGSFERLQNSGGRSLATRAMQVFKKDRYIVTAQSLKALASLMVKSAPTDCATGRASGDSTPQRCCGGSATALQFSCDSSGVEAILVKLSSMRGSPPMSEAELMGALKGGRVGDDDLRRWKQVILKYTRMAY
jgi:hypothetical protein